MDIRAIGIIKEFGTEAALRGIDLEVRSGELMALLGPSGSGKTTLLRVIAGLEDPDGGEIRFGDIDATHLAVRRRRVGFVFQHYALFRHLTVFDNVAFGLRARGRERPPRAEIARRVRELLALVQLGGLEERFPTQLSGGQRQRVALARALAVEPRVLLLDEPFGALDARVRKDLRRSLRDIHDATGQTTIFVTHDQDEALELADRVAILNGGRLEQVGTPDEVHDAPASAFVMSFVGESTHLPVTAADGEVRFRGMPVPVRHATAVAGPASLFLRPEDVGFTSAESGLPGQVVMVRRAAGGRRAEVRLEGDGELLVEVDLAGDEQALARGDSVRIAFRGGRVFPAAPVQSPELRPQSGRVPIP
ncbi:sulfate/molybdate ABC transporter ATP-binding protein [uncultured Enterovirga sp.]|uniref:sulfate/molybdate ABC transporter ATP-binding protein n=1 Tax=uncultured Enterovirga sp. TaxID=2026352 RepID=UPI0035C9E2CC